MPGPIVDVGRNLAVFVSGQASFDTISGAGEDYPVAADAIRVITAAVNGTNPTAMREDKYGSATRVGGIAQKRTAEASLEGYLMPSGTAGTAPDIDELLTASGWTKVAGSGTARTVSSVSGLDVVLNAAATNWAIGDVAVIETATSSGQFIVRRVTGVSGSTLSVTPSFSISTGGNVKAGVLYKPNDKRDDAQDALVLFAFNNNSCDRVSGWTPGSMSLTLGTDEAAKFTISGTGRQHNRLQQTFLATAVSSTSAGTETWTVANGDAAGEYGTNTYWQIEDEIVKLTGKSGASWTVVRNQFSSGNPAHAQDVAIYPWQPTGTYAGGPLAATSGSAVILKDGSSTAVELQVGSATLNTNYAVTYREDIHGDHYKVRGYTMAPREVDASLSGWALRGSVSSGTQTDKMADVAMDALADGATQQLLVQQGDAEGKIVAFECPTFRIGVPSLDRGSEEVTVELTGPAEGSLTGADEVYLMFG